MSSKSVSEDESINVSVIDRPIFFVGVLEYLSKIIVSEPFLTKKPSTKNAPFDILTILPFDCALAKPYTPPVLIVFALDAPDSIVVTVSPSAKEFAVNSSNINVG